MRKKINVKTASPFFTADSARQMVEKYYHYKYEDVLVEAYNWIKNCASRGETSAVLEVHTIKREDAHALCDHLKSNGYQATCIDQVNKIYIYW